MYRHRLWSISPKAVVLLLWDCGRLTTTAPLSAIVSGGSVRAGCWLVCLAELRPHFATYCLDRHLSWLTFLCCCIPLHSVFWGLHVTTLRCLLAGSQYEAGASVALWASYYEPFQHQRAKGGTGLGKISIWVSLVQRPSNQIARKFHVTHECVFIGIRQEQGRGEVRTDPPSLLNYSATYTGECWIVNRYSSFCPQRLRQRNIVNPALAGPHLIRLP